MPMTPIAVAMIAATSLRRIAFWNPRSDASSVTASFMNSFQEKAITNANAAAKATPICTRTSFWNFLAFVVIFLVMLIEFSLLCNC